MDVVLRTSYGEAEISLRNTNDETTLADVIRHVTGQNSAPIVFVDGRALPATTTLGASGILRGSTIATHEPDEPDDDGSVELVQVAGRGSGTSASLSAGHYVLGIGRRASARELDLAPVDEPSFEMIVAVDSGVRVRARTGSIRLDGVLVDVGDTVQWSTEILDSGDRVFQLNRRATAATDRRVRSRASTGRDTVAFTRPHRRSPLLEADPITSSETERISGHHGAERDRRRSANPHVGDLVILAQDRDPRLWERRPGDADVFHVPIGLADIEWSPPLLNGREDRDNALRIIEECGPLPMIPVSVDIAAETGAALIGPHEFTTDLARGFMLGAAVTHGPADLDIVVLTSSERSDAWEWSKWLPHTLAATGPRLLLTESEVRRWVELLRSEPTEQDSDSSAADHLTLVVVDDVNLWRDRDAVLRPLFSEAASSMHFLVLTDDTTGAPKTCPVVITRETDLSTSIEFIDERRVVHNVRPYLASADVATAIALAIAPLDDPELPVHSPDILRSSVWLLDLLRLDQPDAKAFVDRWSMAGPSPSAVVGLSAEGPVDIDLVKDGPHGLIAGSGAGEVAQFFVAGLAANNGPNALNLVLFDLAGNSGVGALGDMPHTVLAEPDLNEQRRQRILKCLSAEVNRRIAGDDESSFPHLVMLADVDAAATSDSHFLDELASIAQSGRDVGFHLLVAIECPGSLVDHKMISASDFRIALRMSEAESIAVLGTSIASLLPTDVPGRAYAQIHRGDEPIPFQATQPDRPLDIQPFVIGRELSPMEHRLIRTSGSTSADSEETVLMAMAAAMNQAVADHDSVMPRRLCTDPLPEQLALRSFFDEHPGDGVPFALVDVPDEQRQETEWWQPDVVGGLLIVGNRGSGKTALLKSLAVGIGERYSADDIHLYCFDAGGSELDPLAQMAHTGAVASPGEAAERLSQALSREYERRIALADEDDALAMEPTIVVIVDGLAEFGDLAIVVEQVFTQGQAVRMHAVVTTNSVDELGVTLSSDVRRVVLGVDNPATPLDTTTPIGRARRADGNEMQLVMPPRDLSDAIDDLGADLPNRQPQLGGRG